MKNTAYNLFCLLFLTKVTVQIYGQFLKTRERNLCAIKCTHTQHVGCKCHLEEEDILDSNCSRFRIEDIIDFRAHLIWELNKIRNNLAEKSPKIQFYTVDYDMGLEYMADCSAAKCLKSSYDCFPLRLFNYQDSTYYQLNWTTSNNYRGLYKVVKSMIRKWSDADHNSQNLLKKVEEAIADWEKKSQSRRKKQLEPVNNDSIVDSEEAFTITPEEIQEEKVPSLDTAPPVQETTEPVVIVPPNILGTINDQRDIIFWSNLTHVGCGIRYSNLAKNTKNFLVVVCNFASNPTLKRSFEGIKCDKCIPLNTTCNRCYTDLCGNIDYIPISENRSNVLKPICKFNIFMYIIIFFFYF